jgi:hypothetical protein
VALVVSSENSECVCEKRAKGKPPHVLVPIFLLFFSSSFSFIKNSSGAFISRTGNFQLTTSLFQLVKSNSKTLAISFHSANLKNVWFSHLRIKGVFGSATAVAAIVVTTQ